MSNKLTIKSIFESDEVKSKFKEILGQRSAAFMTSVLQIASQNDLLAKADPISIYQAAAVAATLDLPLNNNLGFAYIVPYNDRSKGVVAQFQIGYKGFVQLAQRSGQFQKINASPIYEGQIVEANPLDGYVFDFTKKTSNVVIGYAAKFVLINGFEATYYMSIDELRAHGSKYSQSFRKGFGLWKDNFDAMATKTVLKLLLSKYAPLSVEMQTAVKIDQSVVNDFENDDFIYIDNQPQTQTDKQSERILLMLQDCATQDEVGKLSKSVQTWTPELKTAFREKFDSLISDEYNDEQ